MEPFNPEDPEPKVDRWLHRIDLLATIDGWSEYERSCVVQAKLRAAVRTWFNRFHDYDLSWADWKATLRRAFPQRHDFASTLEELIARMKRSGRP